MCGILGILDESIIDGKLDTMFDNMYTMQAQMMHRGPDDGDRIVKFNGGYFMHLRLSIIGDERQPMVSGRYALTMNGEIYNYKELKSYLDDKSGNDCKTFLNYCQRFGLAKTLADANGMWAFGLYDKQDDLLYLSVDRFGQKPCYYYHDDKFFAFASTPNALLWIKDKWKINEEALQSYWILGGIMGENSIFDGIKKLNASELLTFDPKTGKCWKERYWEPVFQGNTNGIEDLVLDSIRKVKVSDVPVHIFLSGGVDSTLVASQCPDFSSIHLDGPERKYAEQVCKKFGNELKIVDPVECDPVEAMTDYVTKSGEPAMAALIPWMVAKEASKFGKVAITANGADELFFGYNRIRELCTKDQTNHMFRGQQLHDDFWIKIWNNNFRGNNLSLAKIGSGRWLELMAYVQFDLNQTLDRASMCHSLEVRSPYLDHRLAEMALSIPESVHRNGYGNKSILKRMLKSMGFDEPFFQRPKLGFSLFKQPANLEQLQHDAFFWAVEQGWLKCDNKKLSGRDRRYLEASAFSFKIWFEVWNHLL